MAFPSDPNVGDVYTNSIGSSFIRTADGAWRVLSDLPQLPPVMAILPADSPGYLRNDGNGNYAWENISLVTNLSIGASSPISVTINNSLGNGVILPAATSTAAGVLPAEDKKKLNYMVVTGPVNLDNISQAGSQITNLGILTGVAFNANNLGTFPGSIIPDGTTIKVALQNLESAIEALTFNGVANLSLGTITSTTVRVNIDTGADVILPAVTTGAAGLMIAADKTKMDRGSVIKVSEGVSGHASPASGDMWYNTGSSVWNVYSSSASSWVAIN